MSRRRHAVVAIASVLLTACGSFDAGSVRKLTNEEIDVLNATRARLAENGDDVSAALADLADNVAYALREQNRLQANVAKAQLLESMKSPWTASPLAATRREVALYHLFALEEAENAVLEARIDARRARIEQLGSAYRRLVASMSMLVAAKQQLLVHLDESDAARLNRFIDELLVESRAFRAALEGSDNPRLERLSEALARRETALADARRRVVELLQQIEEE